MSERFSLAFDRVSLTKTGCDFEVAYIKDGPLGLSMPCVLLTHTKKVPLEAGTIVEGDEFANAVEVSRVAATGGELPEVTRGKLTIDRFRLAAGAAVAGEFSIEFDDGHDLSGAFSETLQDPVPADTCDTDQN